MLFPYFITESEAFIVSPFNPFIILRNQGRRLVIIGEKSRDPDDLGFIGMFDVQLEFAGITVFIAKDPIIVCRFLIGADYPFIISEHDFVHRPGEQVIWGNRDLPSASRRIDHIARNGKSGGMSGQTLHDLDPFGYGGPEMTDSFRKITLIKIIRAYPVLHQLMDEFFHDDWAVVDPCEKNRLVSKRYAGIGKFGNG